MRSPAHPNINSGPTQSWHKALKSQFECFEPVASYGGDVVPVQGVGSWAGASLWQDQDSKRLAWAFGYEPLAPHQWWRGPGAAATSWVAPVGRCPPSHLHTAVACHRCTVQVPLFAFILLCFSSEQASPRVRSQPKQDKRYMCFRKGAIIVVDTELVSF